MTSRPEFKAISPFKVSAEAVADYAKERNIPETVFPPGAAAPAERSVAPPVKLSLELPEDVMEQVRRQAFEARITIRALVLRALQGYGIAVKPAELIEDGRRKQKGTTK